MSQNTSTTFAMVNNRVKVGLGFLTVVSLLVLIAGSVMLAIGITKFNDAKTTTNSMTTINGVAITTTASTSSTGAQTTIPTENLSSMMTIIPHTTLMGSSTTMTQGSSDVFTSTLSPGVPGCIRDIAILIDNSRNVGNVSLFQKQINFITDQLIPAWNINPNATETMAMLYDSFNTSVIGRPFQYYAVQTFIADLQDRSQSFTFFQPSINYGIYSLLQNLSNRRSEVPMVTILFTYSSEFNDVISTVPMISQLNSSLILVGVGDDVDPTVLSYLSGTIMTTNYDYATDGLADMINSAICEPTAPSSPTPMPTTTPSSTLSTPTPYMPCQKFIAFIIDASNDLSDMNFAMQKGAVGLALPQGATHYERFAFGYYSSTANVFDFGRFSSDDDFTKVIAGTSQFNSSPNITRALQAADIGLTLNSTMGISTIIFVTKPDPSDITSAIPFAQGLQSKGKLTIVALLDANIPLLQQLTSHIVVWNDMGSYNLTTWIPAMEEAFGCSNVTPTTTAPLPTTSPIIDPFIPCKSNIVLAVDVSSSMSNDTFFTEGLFIVMTLIQYDWTHYDRVGLMAYAEGYRLVYPYNYFDDYINNPILHLTQQAGRNNITFGLSTVFSEYVRNQQYSIQNTVFFTAASDPDDVTTAQTYATELLQKGPLIIVAYGFGANVTELQRLNPTKIIQVDPSTLPNGGYNNYTAANEIFSAFQCE